MKGSDFVEMTINIGGELIKLNVDFNDQINVRDAEKAVKIYFDKLKKSWPNNSDKNILAMVAYQFAKSYQLMARQQEQAIDLINLKCREIDRLSDINADSANTTD